MQTTCAAQFIVRTNCPASAKMSRVAPAASAASIMQSFRAGRVAEFDENDNELDVKAPAKYILGESLIRVCRNMNDKEDLRFNRKYKCVVKVPSVMQARIRCDACRGNHSTKNRFCSGNRKIKRKFGRDQALRLGDYKLIQVRIDELQLLRHRKRGSAIVTRV